MQITIVTHAPPRSQSGNRVTALRWKKMLCSLGHETDIADKFRNETEVLVAVHADKMAAQVAQFSKKHPDRKIIVVLSGTDIYRDLKNSSAAEKSIEIADRLVTLQPLAQKLLPKKHVKKVRVVFPSAKRPRTLPARLKSCFEISVSGHLRSEKDPFRTVKAAKLLPDASRIRITHLGKALSAEMRKSAKREMNECSRYHWYGEKAAWKARWLVARSRLMINSSNMEGAANVVFEALESGVPILASRIPGNVGVLAEDYPGLFPVGDSNALAKLMSQAEIDPKYYRRLKSACRGIARRFSYSKERLAWRDLIAELS